jgi:integral membrane protein (TIGR01906 family)
MSGIFYRLASLLITLLVPPLLVLASTRIVMTEPYLRIEYNKPDFPQDYYGMSLDERLQYAPYVLHYLLSNADISYLANLQFSTGAPLYTPPELQHMVDVKNVFQAANRVLLVVVITFVALSLLLLLSPKGRLALRYGLRSGTIFLLVDLAALVALMLVNWQDFFSGFHNMFFASGTWVFDYSDTLIRLFPIRFWQDSAITVGVISGVSAVLIVIGCALWGWWEKHTDALTSP